MDNYLDIKSKYDELLNEKELLEKELKTFNYSSIKDKANEKIETIKQNYYLFRKQIDPLLLKIEKLSKGNFKLSFIKVVILGSLFHVKMYHQSLNIITIII